MYYHYQNLKKDQKETNKITDFRFWLGQNPCLECEICIPPSVDILSLQLNLNYYGDTAIGGHIIIWPFSLYWNIEWRPLYNFLNKITRRKGREYSNGRCIGFSLNKQSLSLSLWEDPMESDGRDPWWWRKYIFFDDFFLGKAKCSTEVLEEKDTVVPMPEKSYEAHAKLMMYTWKRPRWFTKQLKRVQIDVPEGIPHEGKGENSWDCGEDRTFGMTTGECSSIAQGVGDLVGSVLRDRVRYGGWSDWNYKR